MRVCLFFVWNNILKYYKYLIYRFFFWQIWHVIHHIYWYGPLRWIITFTLYTLRGVVEDDWSNFVPNSICLLNTHFQARDRKKRLIYHQIFKECCRISVCVWAPIKTTDSRHIKIRHNTTYTKKNDLHISKQYIYLRSSSITYPPFRCDRHRWSEIQQHKNNRTIEQHVNGSVRSETNRKW